MNKFVNGFFPPCPICSKETQPWSRGLMDIYNKHNLGVFCDSCGEKATSFLNYWGEKRQEDEQALFDFVNNGDEPQRKLSALMNGGYYE